MPFKVKFSNQSDGQHFDFELSESSTDAHPRTETERKISEWVRVASVGTLRIVVIFKPPFWDEFFAIFEMFLH